MSVLEFLVGFGAVAVMVLVSGLVRIIIRKWGEVLVAIGVVIGVVGLSFVFDHEIVQGIDHQAPLWAFVMLWGGLGAICLGSLGELLKRRP